MQNIILLFTRFGTHITFVILQVLCFVLIIKYNKSQNAIFINSANYYVNQLDAYTSTWSSYIKLGEVNDSLAGYNADLMERFINAKIDLPTIEDTALQYNLIPANVINNTFRLRNNHMTLDKGYLDGVRKDMGVISERGIIGIVRNVTDHYAHVITLLNSQSRISATVKPYAFPGSLIWKGMDPFILSLESIPKYANIAIGDTVETNGYSTIFPPSLPIGSVQSFEIDKGSSDYSIEVKIFNNISNTGMVYIVNNQLSSEQKAVESIDHE